MQVPANTLAVLLLVSISRAASAERPAWATDVLFEAGSATVSSQDRARIASAVGNIPSSSRCASGLWIVVGHADKGDGSAVKQVQLAEERANAVSNLLLLNGVSASAIRAESRAANAAGCYATRWS